MRTFVTLMAAALFAVSVGCAPEAEEAAGTPTAKPAESAPAASAEAKPVGAEAEKTAEKEGEAEFQTVSLKLPGMT